MKLNVTLDEVDVLIKYHLDTANTYAAQLTDFDKNHIKRRIGYWSSVRRQLEKEK